LANVEQITRDYLLRARTEGVAETTAAAQRLGAATDSLATKTETVSKSQVSAATALERHARSLDLAYRSSQKFEAVQRDLDRAKVQGLEGTKAYTVASDGLAAAQAKAAEQFGKASVASRLFSQATSGVSGNLIAMSAGLGPVGVALAGLHPVGLVVAATFGLLVSVFERTGHMADEFADKANNIRRIIDQAQVSGVVFKVLSDQFKKVGLDADDVGNLLLQVNRRFSELREGGGKFLEVVRGIDGGIADMMQRAQTTEEVLFGLQAAMLKAGDTFKRTELFQAAGGRGGPRAMAAFMNFDFKQAIEDNKVALAEFQSQVTKVSDLKRDADLLEGKGKTTLGLLISDEVQARNLIAMKLFNEAANELKERGDTLHLAWLQVQLLFKGEFSKVLDLNAVAARRAAADVRDYTTALDAMTVSERNAAIAAQGGRGRPRPQGRIGVGGADFNDPLRREPAPQQPDATFNDRFDFQGALDPKAQLANLKAVAAAMGAGATESLKLNIAQKELAESYRLLKTTGEPTLMQVGQHALAVQALTVASQKAIVTAKEQLGVARDEEIVNSAVADARLRLAVAGVTDAKSMAVATEVAKRSAQDRINAQNALRDPIKQVSDSIALQTEQHRIEAETLNMTAGQAMAYKLVQEEIVKAKIALKPLDEDQIARLRKEAEGLAKVVDQGNNFKLAQQYAQDFTNSLVQGLMSGKSLMDLMAGALKSLASSMATGAIKSALSGDFIMAGIQAVGAVIANLLGNAAEERKKQQELLAKAVAANVEAVHADAALAVRRIAATGQDNTLAGLLRIKDFKDVEEQVDAIAKGIGRGTAKFIEILNVEALERLKIEQDFNAKAIEDAKAAADAQAQIAKDIADRQLSFQDQVFEAANDNTTLAGQLAAFDRTAARDRAAEVAAGGEAIVDFEAAKAAQRLQITKSFADKEVEAVKAAEQQKLDAINGAAKNVLEYITGLISGPASTLSPQAVLSNAQSAYNANLVLAQGNPASQTTIDAVNKFPQVADNLEKAARAYYGSSVGYQTIRDAIIAQGLALPTVQQATDPIVNALALLGTQYLAGIKTNTLDTKTEVANGLSQSGAVANGLGVTGVIKQAINGTLAPLGDISGNTDETAANAGQTATNVTTSNSILNAIQALQDTAKSQLQLLNSQIAGSAVTITSAPGTAGSLGGATATGTGTTVNNPILRALNIIVINTKAAVDHLAYLSSHIAVGAQTYNVGIPNTTGIYAAQGAIAPAGMGVIYGEHNLGGPYFGRFNEPIAITPNMPGNDNGGVVRELQSLRRESADQNFKIAQLIDLLCTLTGKSREEIVGAIEDQTDTIKSEARQDRNNPQRRAA
jgi:hypothetical protein